MSEFAIELEDVSKRYRLFRNGRWRILDVLGLHVPRNVYHDFWALQDISLSVPSGQRFGIIGRNGAGKSSLLKIIAGLIKPTEGKVSVKGNVQTLMELGTGFHPEFTGRQNVFAALALAGVTGRDAQARFDDIVDFAELEGFIDSPLKTYSSGMQARLAFSVATTFKPEILIIDEILSVGDAYFAGKCFERMSKLTREQGATVLYVSHDLSSVQAACDRVVWLKRGRVFQDGDPLSVVMAYYKEVQDEENRRLRTAARQPGEETRRSPGMRLKDWMTLRFRLVVEGGVFNNPGHKIREVRLCRDHEVLCTIGVGTANDSQQLTPGHLLDVHDGCWSRPLQDQEGWFRLLTQGPNGVGQASLQVSFPDTAHSVSVPLTLEIRADASTGATVSVELDEAGGRHWLGTLVPEQEWHRFDLPRTVELSRERLQTPSSGGDLPEQHATGNPETEFREAKIEAVRFLNSKGQSVFGITEGDELVIEIDYDAVRPVDSPIFAVSIYLLDGKALCRALSTQGGQLASPVVGKGKVRFLFRPFYAGPGEYVMTAEIFKRLNLAKAEQPEIYDRHDRAYRFRVWKRLGTVLDIGLVAMPYAVEHVCADPKDQGRRNFTTSQ